MVIYGPVPLLSQCMSCGEVRPSKWHLLTTCKAKQLTLIARHHRMSDVLADVIRPYFQGLIVREKVIWTSQNEFRRPDLLLIESNLIVCFECCVSGDPQNSYEPKWMQNEAIVKAIRKDRLCQIQSQLRDRVSRPRSDTTLMVWQLIDKTLCGFVALPGDLPVWLENNLEWAKLKDKAHVLEETAKDWMDLILNCPQVLWVTAGDDPEGLMFQVSVRRTCVVHRSPLVPRYSTIRSQRWLSQL